MSGYIHFKDIANQPSFTNGTYIKKSGSATVYVVAGGAPIPVPSWTSVGGGKKTVTIPSGSIKKRPFNEYPASGTYVREYGKLTVYIIAGGAPIPLPSWASVGGGKKFTSIPVGSINFSMFKDYPVNQTYVREHGSQTVYVVAGGALMPISSWASVGGGKKFTSIPSGSTKFAIFNKYPIDGTYVRGHATRNLYLVDKGTAHLTNWLQAGVTFTDVDQKAIDTILMFNK